MQALGATRKKNMPGVLQQSEESQGRLAAGSDQGGYHSAIPPTAAQQPPTAASRS